MSNTRTPASGSLLFPVEAALLLVEDDIPLDNIGVLCDLDLTLAVVF